MGCLISKGKDKRTLSIDIADEKLYDVPNWKIKEYLVNHPEVIEQYIQDHSHNFHDLHQLLDRQKTLNEFMLDLVKSIFNDMLSIDVVIQKVVAYAPKLVDADRASLFLLDNNKSELYARIYSAINGNSPNNWKEIRFKIGLGIAGRVAETGETLNIPDAYADPRFNRAVDQETGYVTKSILCMPIFIHGVIMGVVQMVNKKRDSQISTFDEDDVRAFEHFALYCGLALHHAKLYEKIRKADEKFKVALEMLAYHSYCTDQEFQEITTIKTEKVPPDLKEFSFITTRMDNNQRVHLTVWMFFDLFGLNRFDRNTLYRFIITVKKNYRRVPYHNWIHAFTVAHCMYCILRRKNRFNELECLALFVASLCHDLDHRGKNNQFLVDTSSPLSTIYQSSQLEHHHFNQTVSIIQQDGLNILSHLSPKQYKEILGNMKSCILATDLNNHFTAKVKLTEILAKNKFSWNDSEHRLLAQGIVMTACDLSACAKSWEVHAETVNTILQEFWDQGDLEKKQGRTPIPMMDRDMVQMIPISQCNFLSNICVDCYKLLGQLIPETQSLLDGTLQNLKKWQTMAELDKKKGSGQKKLSLHDKIPKFEKVKGQ